MHNANTSSALRVNAHQSALLQEFQQLRNKAFALNVFIGARFARDAAAGCKEDGFKGLAQACWALSAELHDVPGSYDVYALARELGTAFASEVR
jgi:hypothetical protein